MEIATAPSVATETPPEPKPVSKAKRRAAASSEDNAVKVAKLRKGEPAVDATHMAAYQAYAAGDDAAAARLYRQVIQTEPRNVDAWLGLAAVAARQDKTDEAAAHYQHALELEPRNSTAQAGLIALLGQANPVEAESRIKTLIAQQPDAAHLHAALGSVYADQNQWPNAQQAYFQAFSLDAGSAEYAFNLAVSLDQLRKPDLALDYYQKALALASRQGGAVDKAALESRISQLRSALGK
jgi:tetratricopeptide (TPR) repeat protein